MSDITELFSRVASTADATPATETVEADLARGQRALARDHRQRTIRRSMAGTGVVAGVAVAVVIGAQISGSGTERGVLDGVQHVSISPAPPDHVAKAKVHRARKMTPVKLVSYDGKQLAGFTVDKVPDGWFLSTSTQYALLIDPAGDKDNDPDAFNGKLAVLTQSTDVHGLPKGRPVTVNGEAGTIRDQGKYGLSLAYTDPQGFGVVIQAPPTLNWSDDQLVSFADGVHVTGNALPSHG
jgi:hypothetical protein